MHFAVLAGAAVRMSASRALAAFTLGGQTWERRQSRLTCEDQTSDAPRQTLSRDRTGSSVWSRRLPSIMVPDRWDSPARKRAAAVGLVVKRE
jgi:hypothetical protein